MSCDVIKDQNVFFFRGNIKYCFNLNKDRFVLTQQYSEYNSLSIGSQRDIYIWYSVAWSVVIKYLT